MATTGSDSQASKAQELRRLAEKAVAEGRVDLALPYWERLAVLAPDDADNLHNLVLGYLNLSIRHNQAGELDQAAALLTKAVPRLARTPEFRVPISRGLSALANAFLMQRKNPEQAIRLSRLSMVADRDDGQTRINHESVLTLAVGRGELVDFADDLKAEDLACKIFIACFPKSGSTFLSHVMQTVSGFEPMIATYGFWENEQELYVPAFLQMARKNAVVQIHVKASMPNIHIMQAFRIRPVLLVRNIFDVLLSWKEFLDRGAWVNTYCKEYLSLSDADRMNYIVDDRASWYLQFFSSWCYAVGSGLIGAKFIAYQDLIADKPGTIGSICTWYGLAKSGDEIAAAIDRVENAGGTRFNKGVVGRGLQAFSDAQRSKIAEMARRHYPSVDFSPIGLAR